MSDCDSIKYGLHVLEEITGMLARIRFDVRHGAYVEGRSATVLINTQPNDDGQTYRLLLTLSACGRQAVDWPHHTVFLHRKDGSGVTWMSTTDSRGQARFSAIDPGDYGMAFLLRSKADPHGSVPRDIPVAEQSPEPLEARVPGVRVYKTGDNLVMATLTERPQGVISIRFETQDPELEGALIRFEYLTSTDVAASGQLVLKPVKTGHEVARTRIAKTRHAPVKLAAEWKGSVPPCEPCELVFSVETR